MGRGGNQYIPKAYFNQIIRNKKVIFEQRDIHGSLHSEFAGEPVKTVFHKQQLIEAWIKIGQTILIKKWHKSGQTKQEGYYLDNQLHRSNGPALREWRKNGQLKLEAFYVNGRTANIETPIRLWNKLGEEITGVEDEYRH